MKEIIRVLNTRGVRFSRDNYKFVIEGELERVVSLKEKKPGLSGIRVVGSDLASISDQIQDYDDNPIVFTPIASPRVSMVGFREDFDFSEEDKSYANSPIKFEMEICKLGSGLHGLKLKRLEGDAWLYKDFCKSLISDMKL